MYAIPLLDLIELDRCLLFFSFFSFAPKSFPIMCGTVTIWIVKDCIRWNRESVADKVCVFMT